MSDTLKKVLLGAVVGALLVVFYGHVSSERAKRDPAAKGGPPAAAAGRPAGGPPGGAGGFSSMPIGVLAVPVRSEQISFELEALGTTRANESVEITAKVVNQVTAVRFAEGQQVAKGAVLVELDSDQVRADLAAASQIQCFARGAAASTLIP